jgi:hypothetical protein
MKHVVAVLCVVGPGALLGFAQEASQPSKSPLLGEGYLQQVRTPLEHIFRFTFEGSNLKIDRQSWETAPKGASKVDLKMARLGQAHPVEAIFRQIQTAAKGGGSSTVSIGIRERDMSFLGANLAGRLHVRDDTLRLVLEESQSPRRTLDFSEDGDGGFRIQVTHPDGDLILLRQTRKGNFAAIALVGGQMFAGQDSSFLSFFQQHRRAMDTHILPVLQQFGIEPILSPHAPKVRKAVLALLSRTPETLEEGKKLLADLDSAKFVIREKASRLLNDRFEIYRDLMQEKLKDKSISLEVKTRLNKILAEHTDARWVSQVVAALNLTQDAGYLVSLLDHVTPEEAPRLLGHLEKTTGQKLGSDPVAWKAWAKKTLK